jgi:hypothetical protein
MHFGAASRYRRKAQIALPSFWAMDVLLFMYWDILPTIRLTTFLLLCSSGMFLVVEDYMEDQSVQQLLTQIQQQLQPLTELSTLLITRAEIQAYTEDLYNQLVNLAHEGIQFLGSVQLGQVIDSEWIEERDGIVQHAQRLVLDAPNAKPPA